MHRGLLIFFSISIFVVASAFLNDPVNLRALYSKPISEWPKADIDSGVAWKEFEALPKIDTSYFRLMEQPEVKLGKLLFFDPLLSGSGQISCSSCHDPQISWGDKRSVALGNDHLSGKRNTISLLNVAQRKTLFWDGRATTLEGQAKGPIEAHNEMAMEPKKVGKKIGGIKEYTELFKAAFGDEKVTYDKIVSAIASFERTITSRQSRFDLFLAGRTKALTDQEIEGLHLFRTKARCMNCHYGQYLTDEEFHNIGLTYYKRKYEDLGRYKITKNPEDVGKFRTPSLRDVMHGGPWMHNGLFDNIEGVINIYNSGMHMIDPKPEQKVKDPLYPQTDKLLKPLHLTKAEKEAIVAFLGAMSAAQYKMPRPVLPR
ncbi:cytochrome-c peroxidase [Pedobacter sp. HMWF019]|uniref:cytochrome-c peroxidase n=1 Tax=Pedobacter sp. HMWF019 TaxID=2056856 RepID=UPI000D336598|nr:cytochrome c peroxidase [Pedobacter sp. HMWF019]PTS95873.1 cytochrome-c peroxidase [Pedobacter sp. HMWF019]